MNEIIRSNNRFRKRRIIECLRMELTPSAIAWQMESLREFRRQLPSRRGFGSLLFGKDTKALTTVGQHFFARPFDTWFGMKTALRLLKSHLNNVLTDADIAHLKLVEMPLPERLLSTISSCVLEKGCRVDHVSFRGTEMSDITSSVLHRFLSRLACNRVDFIQIYSFSYGFIGPEVLQFIVTRPHFSLSRFGSYPIPIDDSILAQVTALEFTIGAPNMITADGLKSFIEVTSMTIFAQHK
ncbi:hypothetical protein COOONC_03563 [Cooperia oncophora]